MKKKAKHDALTQLVQFVEKHFQGVIICAAIAVILLPGIVWCVFYFSSCGSWKVFSADGLLCYIGALFTGLLSLLVAVIALVQSKRIAEIEEDRAIEARQNAIRPVLQVEVKKIEDNFFDLTITNHGQFVAIGVYLFTNPFAPVIVAGEPFCRKFSIGGRSQTIFAVDESECAINSDGYPPKLWFCFSDVDNNFWQQEFVYGTDGYESQGVESI